MVDDQRRELKNKEESETAREKEMREIRVFLAEHSEEFVTGGDSMAVAEPVEMLEVVKTGGGRQLRDYMVDVRRAGEMFPRRGHVKKKKKLGVLKGEESVEEQLRRANDMFMGVLGR
jgi:hypothetical protein